MSYLRVESLLSMEANTYQYPVRVYYEDTDAGGVVYHSQYLNFCERARTEWLRELDINQSLFLSQQIAFVVKKMDINFVASAKLDDLLNVKSSIIKMKKASLIFKQEIFNAEQQLIFTAQVLIASINLAQAKPCAIPESILGALKSVC